MCDPMWCVASGRSRVERMPWGGHRGVGRPPSSWREEQAPGWGKAQTRAGVRGLEAGEGCRAPWASLMEPSYFRPYQRYPLGRHPGWLCVWPKEGCRVGCPVIRGKEAGVLSSPSFTLRLLSGLPVRQSSLCKGVGKGLWP